MKEERLQVNLSFRNKVRLYADDGDLSIDKTFTFLQLEENTQNPLNILSLDNVKITKINQLFNRP